jgi:excisionase family DNA binding protein
VVNPAPAKAVEPLLLSDAQCAELLGCSRSHFRNMLRLGKCPLAIKLGRLSRWRRAEIEAWVVAGMPPSHRWTWRPEGRP